MKAFQFKITELSHFGWALWDPTDITGLQGDSSVQGTRQYGCALFLSGNINIPWIPKFTSSARQKWHEDGEQIYYLIFQKKKAWK